MASMKSVSRALPPTCTRTAMGMSQLLVMRTLLPATGMIDVAEVPRPPVSGATGELQVAEFEGSTTCAVRRGLLAGPVQEPLVRQQPFDADRPAGVQLVRADADLGAQAVPVTVGKAIAGVV